MINRGALTNPVQPLLRGIVSIREDDCVKAFVDAFSAR